jgi:transcriptional regulator with XRE-family HTH domain
VPRLVRVVMTMNGLNQAALAEAITAQGVPTSAMTISRRLRRKASPFGHDEIQAMEEAFELPRGFFFQDPDALIERSTGARLFHAQQRPLSALPDRFDAKAAKRAPAGVPLLTLVRG